MATNLSTAHHRASTLHGGMNYSWLEQYYNGTPGINYMDYINLGDLPAVQAHIQLMSTMGFSTLRLPVSFDHWNLRTLPYIISASTYFTAIDQIIIWCDTYGMKLIIDNHFGVLSDASYSTEVSRVSSIWQQVAHRYRNTDPEKVFFEIYNEPFNISDSNWKNSAISFVNAIRAEAPNHTIVVGANDWNIIIRLVVMGVLEDPNIIYTFHYYDPLLFSHQGATWGGPDVQITGVPFPYNSSTMPANSPSSSYYSSYPTDATYTKLLNDISVAKNFGSRYNVPVWCGEFGSYAPYAPNDGSRCRYTGAIKGDLDKLIMPYAYWEWDEGFSIFNGTPSLGNLPACMAAIFP